MALIFLLSTSWFVQEWPALVERLGKAAPSSNAGELRTVRGSLLAADFAKLPPADEARVRYSIAYADRALAFARGTTAGERRELLLDAIQQLERAIAINARDAEAHALLGSAYGTLIGSFPARASELGPKGRAALDRAEALAPHNPRVQVLRGISAFHTPAEFGGGYEKAETHLRRAVALFRNEPASKPWPNWGRYDAHVWLGQSLAKLQRRDEALEHYRAALAIAPESEYVRRILIPAVQR